MNQWVDLISDIIEYLTAITRNWHAKDNKYYESNVKEVVLNIFLKKTIPRTTSSNYDIRLYDDVLRKTSDLFESRLRALIWNLLEMIFLRIECITCILEIGDVKETVRESEYFDSLFVIFFHV